MVNATRSASTMMTIILLICVSGGVACQNSQSGSSWQDEFQIPERKLSPTGRNPYFILEPGFQLNLESKNARLLMTVLDETKIVNGVTTRVVEEREWKNGNLREVSRNFFAICEDTKDVFYFGEEVDMYKGGKVDNHKGAWLTGQNNARAGLIMPGEPTVGMKYYQEVAPGVAMDRAEVASTNENFETPAGSFSGCLKTKESTPLNFLEREVKRYAPGIGLIQDEKLLLTKYGFMEIE
jgi:hypothetical protein